MSCDECVSLKAEVERLRGELSAPRRETIKTGLNEQLEEAKALLARWLQRDDSMANCEATVQMATAAWLEKNR